MVLFSHLVYEVMHKFSIYVYSRDVKHTYWYHRRTHVFVSDPTQGYGLYIDWMLQKETEIAEGA